MLFIGGEGESDEITGAHWTYWLRLRRLVRFCHLYQ